MAKRKKKKRTGLGTGQACMGLNVKSWGECPFRSTEVQECGSMAAEINSCNINDGKGCDPKHCKLKEYGRIIVDWSK